MKEKIFEPFVRLKETQKQQGSGIGLALALSLTHLHKGELQLIEGKKCCNTFYLKLPLNPETDFKTNEVK